MTLRATQQNVEVLGTASNSSLRATQQNVEVLGLASNSVLRVTQQYVEYLRPFSVPTPGGFYQPISDTLDFEDSTLAYLNIIEVEESLLFSEELVTLVNSTLVTDTLTFTEAVHLSQTYTFNISESMTFASSESPTSNNFSIVDGILFSEQIVLNDVYELVLNNSISFSQDTTIDTNAVAAYITEIFNISEIITYQIPYNLEILDELEFESVIGGSFPHYITVNEYFDFFFDTENATYDSFIEIIECNIYGERPIGQGFQINEQIKVTHLKESGIDVPITSTLSLGQEILDSRSIKNTIEFAQTVNVEINKTTSNSIEFDHIVNVNKIQIYSVTTSFNVTHRFNYTMPNNYITHRYHPFIGEDSDPNAPTPPTSELPAITKYNNIQFSYPVSGPTLYLTLKGPDLGDSEELQYTRINRETRGGTLIIFSDPIWPKQKQFNLQFSLVQNTDYTEIITFLNTTLGKEIKFRDWYGQEYTVINLTPLGPIVQNLTDNSTLTLKLESTL